MNLLGAFSRMGVVMPGYVQGAGQANQDNWSDVMNYDKAIAQETSNLFDWATFTPNVKMKQLDAANAQLGHLNYAMNTAVPLVGFGNRLNMAVQGNFYDPMMNYYNQQANLNQGAWAAQQSQYGPFQAQPMSMPNMTPPGFTEFMQRYLGGMYGGQMPAFSGRPY